MSFTLSTEADAICDAEFDARAFIQDHIMDDEDQCPIGMSFGFRQEPKRDKTEEEEEEDEDTGTRQREHDMEQGKSP